jgi:signal transduction histidine kinase
MQVRQPVDEVDDDGVIVSRDVAACKRTQEAFQFIAARAHCLLWHAEVEEQADGALCWKLTTIDEEAARRFFPVEIPAGWRYVDAWYESRLPEDKARMCEVALREVRAGRSYTQEFRCRRADGEIRWMSEDVQIDPVARGRWRAVGVVVDITERKRAEAALEANRDREQRFRERLAALHEVVLKLAAASSTDELSRRAVELGTSRLGFERLGLAYVSEQPGMMEGAFGTDQRGEVRDGRGGFWPVGPEDGPLATILSGRARMVRAENVPLTGLGGVVGRGDTALAGLWDGTRSIGSLATDNLFTGRPLTDDDCELLKLYAASIGHLCARFRAQEALQAADREKDQFIAMLAHELRNPLAPILTSCQLLQRMGPSEPRLVRAREIIDRQVKHQARLLDDLLDVSRITRGLIPLRIERTDLTLLVRDIGDDCRSVLEDAGLKLHLDLPEPPLYVDGDRTRLSQVVGNLLQNAAKFTEWGGDVFVRVSKEVEAHSNNGRRQRGRAVVSVRDTGIGIEAPMLSRVFDTFSQADHSLDRGRGGLGLGLALVKGLVEMHHGEVRVASAGPGRGSEFTVLLPLAGEESGEQLPAPEVPSHGARRCRVLIVEDVWDTAESLRALLELAGCSVAVAYTGAEALELAPRFRPDLVLCDLGLPDLSGLQVAQELRRSPVTASARIVALSGFGQAEDQQQCREAGFDLHLTKPVEFEELERLLELQSTR